MAMRVLSLYGRALMVRLTITVVHQQLETVNKPRVQFRAPNGGRKE